LESEQFFISFIDWNKIDVLISTPSQFDILLKAQSAKNSVSLTPKFVVLDEFDQMLTDKKYFRSIQNLLSDLGANARGARLTENMLERKVVNPHQFILSGASMLKKFFGVPAKEFLEDHFSNIKIIQSERFLRLNPKIKHEDFNVSGLSEEDRFLLTKQLLERDVPQKAIIFCNDSGSSVEVSNYLTSQGILSSCFHSKMSDNERADTIFKFETNKIVCLVTTDLACRGMDFKNVKLVIQFQYAENGISLLHRIGRTGRFGTSGKGIPS
jgi:superfamily II DNA/RNA helicase